MYQKNKVKKKVKFSRYRAGVAQRVGTGIALLLYDHGTRRGLVVRSTPWPHFTPGKDPVPILQEAGWAPGPVWTGGKSRPHRDSIPDHRDRSQSLYRLSYSAHRRIQSLSLNVIIFILVAASVGRLQDFQKRQTRRKRKRVCLNMLLIGFIRTFLGEPLSIFYK